MLTAYVAYLMTAPIGELLDEVFGHRVETKQ